MALNFSTQNLILTRQTVRASGGNSAIYVNGVDVTAALSGALGSTGQQAYNLAVGIGTNLSGNLTTTGQTLYQRETSISGWTNTVVSGGLETRIFATGAAAFAAAQVYSNSVGTNLSGNLTTTGQTLYQITTGLSGQHNTDFATKTNLALTGSNLYILSTGLSGQLTTDLATKTNLGLTGSNLYNIDTALSGAFNTKIGTTGSNLYNTVTGMSGALAPAFVVHAYTLVTGNFTFTKGIERYLWSGSATGVSGVALNWATGTLPDASTLSGIDFVIKNIHPSTILTISGLVDFSQNTFLGSMQSLTLGSNSSTWLAL